MVLSRPRSSAPEKKPAHKAQPHDVPFAVLIDDDSVSANVLRSLMSEAGFAEKLQVISSAEVALTYFTALRPGRENGLQIVFLDLGFPQGNGFEILRAIRANPACAGLYVIVLTGSDHREDKDDSFSLGADAYLKKFPTVSEMRTLRENLALRNS